MEDCADQQAVGPALEPWQHAKMISQRNKAESYVKARALLKERQRNRATAAGFLVMVSAMFAIFAVTLLPLDEAVMNALTLGFGALILLGFCVLFIVDYDFNAILAWFPRVSRHACAGLFVFPALMVVQQLCVEPYELWYVSWFGVMCTLPTAIWVALHLRELIALSNPQLWLPTEVICIWQCSQMAGHAVYHGSMACGLVAGNSAARFGWSRSAFGLVAGVSLLCALTVGWLLTARNSRFTGRRLACDGRRFGLSSPTIRMMISVGLMNTTLQTLFRAKFVFPGDGAAGAAAGGTAVSRCAQQFEDWQGSQPSLWLDCICVDAAYQEESLVCLPIYMQACRGVLVLCGPTFFERLWCVWELYTAFAFSDGSPSLVIAMVQHPGESPSAPEGQQGSERVGAELRARLNGFMLANAHCANPNEEKRLRNAISAAPGGTAAFQDTIRGLSSKLVGRTDARGGRVVLGDFEVMQQTAAEQTGRRGGRRRSR